MNNIQFRSRFNLVTDEMAGVGINRRLAAPRRRPTDYRPAINDEQ